MKSHGNGFDVFLRIIDTINEWVGPRVSFLVIFLTLVVAVDVFMRYFLNNSTSWGYETACWLMGGMALLGAGYTELKKGHVNVNILVDKFSPRVRAAFNVVTYFLSIMAIVPLVWMGGESTWDSFVHNYRSESTWGPLIWPILLMVPIGVALLVLQMLANWVRDWFTLINGVERKSQFSDE